MDARTREMWFDAVDSLDNVDDFRWVLDRVKDAMQAKAKEGLRIGTKVTFDAGRRGVVTGKVIKVNEKRVKVDAGHGMVWSVSPTLLTIL